MSALAHRLEERGIATVAIGLIRAQMEKVRPPRGLWVPFELGRPLGEPEDAGFQRRVLMAALGLLERRDGPTLIEDFPDDPPGWRDRPGWRPPFETMPDAEAGAEVAAVRPFWDRARARFGRSTVGLSGWAPEEWSGVAERFLAGERPPAVALRFMVDDIKAYYSEAVQAAGEAPASRQIDAWFWTWTAAARLILALRAAARVDADKALAVIGERFLVPGRFAPPG